MNQEIDVLVIGAGPAGLAAAAAAREAGCENVLILERDDAPGGIQPTIRIKKNYKKVKV